MFPVFSFYSDTAKVPDYEVSRVLIAVIKIYSVSRYTLYHKHRRRRPGVTLTSQTLMPSSKPSETKKTTR